VTSTFACSPAGLDSDHRAAWRSKRRSGDQVLVRSIRPAHRQELVCRRQPGQTWGLQEHLTVGGDWAAGRSPHVRHRACQRAAWWKADSHHIRALPQHGCSSPGALGLAERPRRSGWLLGVNASIYSGYPTAGRLYWRLFASVDWPARAARGPGHRSGAPLVEWGTRHGSSRGAPAAGYD